MSPILLAIWGLAGGFIVIGLEFIADVRRARDWPWRQQDAVPVLPYMCAALLRMIIGAVLAAAFGGSGQVAGPAGALMIGVSAPLIIEKVAKQITVEVRSSGGTDAG